MYTGYEITVCHVRLEWEPKSQLSNLNYDRAQQGFHLVKAPDDSKHMIEKYSLISRRNDY